MSETDDMSRDCGGGSAVITSNGISPATAAAIESPTEEDGCRRNKFICGVVEGFYGRPWTTEQRKDLFGKLSKWGMDSYVYAPKDDYKHRAYWRELYTVEEGDHLAGLIAAAKEHNIVFYYALSPGLDMTYSSVKEVAVLKRKLEQVSQFGCEAFALLFDDIESEMTKADKDVFQTFAHAQVSVTNEIYQHLKAPKFLFCPTQYCSTRAVPSVSASEYLLTLGSKLALDIDVLWTGPRVISKELTRESLQEVTEALRRPPVIWDNIHANDYDQKRVFLGPYSGRSPEIIPLLRGVLTNPNCEFHANAIAIHTLAHWSKCRTDNSHFQSSLSAAEVRLESETDDLDGADAALCSAAANQQSIDVYHPRIALRNAIVDWLPEFFRLKESFGPITKPHPGVAMVLPVMPIIPSINTCMSLTTNTTTTSTTSCCSSASSGTMKVAEVNTAQLQALADVCSVVTGTDTITLPNIVMNSLVSSTTIVTNTTITNPIVSASLDHPLPSVSVPVSSIGLPIRNTEGTGYQINDDDDDEDPRRPSVADETEDDLMGGPPPEDVEPMDVSTLLSPKHTPKLSITDDIIMAENGSISSTGSMQIECSADAISIHSAEMQQQPATPNQTTAPSAASSSITAADISLMCDLFYLPFEHGSRALRLLNEFNWLKSNAAVLVNSNNNNSNSTSKSLTDASQEWYQRADRFYALSHSVLVLAKRLAGCANRELCFELFAYVWDIAGVVTLLEGFVRWLALGSFPATINSYTQGSYTWFSKGWRETFTSGDQEPWVFRGGLTADLQRLIPVDSGNDLFLYKLPEVPTTSFPTIRPYVHSDEPRVYSICHRTCRDGSDCTDLFPPDLQTIPADRLIGPFVTLNPELCLVVVDDDGDEDDHDGVLLGYACATLDAKQFYRNQEMCWMPAMCEKYPVSLLDKSENLTSSAVVESINHFHHFKYDCPHTVLATHPSMMTCCVLKDQFIADQSTAKRLVTVLLAALRSNGSSGVHASINNTDLFLHQFYSKLGFVELYQEPTGKVYMGRNF